MRRSSSMFLTRSRNVLLLFPAIPDRLPNTLRVSHGQRNPALRVCMGHCARQGQRDHMEDRIALVPVGLRLSCSAAAATAGESKQQRACGGGGGGGGYATLVEQTGGDSGGDNGGDNGGDGDGDLALTQEFCFAGVYDGHAGHRVADFLKCHLHAAVARRLCATANPKDAEAQMAQAFADVDAEVCGEPELAEAGSCAVVACVVPRLPGGHGGSGGSGMLDSPGLAALGVAVVVEEGEEEEEEGGVGGWRRTRWCAQRCTAQQATPARRRPPPCPTCHWPVPRSSHPAPLAPPARHQASPSPACCSRMAATPATPRPAPTAWCPTLSTTRRRRGRAAAGVAAAVAAVAAAAAAVGAASSSPRPPLPA